ncbi:MAG TPA: DUF2793 domain-containing protein, partial [Rhizomicrobium sp.]|nr:DUF2793 domain-containing protein [Rhizomicrobium sp.]
MLTPAEAVAQLIADQSVAHDIIHGPSSGDSSLVTTESGAVPTFARVMADCEAAAGSGASLWARPVISTLSAAPASPVTGDRYLVAHNGTSGDFVGHEDEVAEWNGSAWAYSGAPLIGQRIYHRGNKYALLWNDNASKWERGQPFFIFAGDFGVVGDGTTADDAACDAAHAAAAALGANVWYGSKVVKLTAAHTWASGFYFDSKSYGNANDPGFLVTGNGGYTAITLSSGFYGNVQGTIYGTGNTANGLVLQNLQQSNDFNIRVYKLDGAGITINKSWDCARWNFSVENCGKSAGNLYAFSMQDDGDTCN